MDDSAVPHQPPYIAYVSNLPYDIEEDDLRDLFADMQVSVLECYSKMQLAFIWYYLIKNRFESFITKLMMPILNMVLNCESIN